MKKCQPPATEKQQQTKTHLNFLAARKNSFNISDLSISEIKNVEIYGWKKNYEIERQLINILDISNTDTKDSFGLHGQRQLAKIQQDNQKKTIETSIQNFGLCNNQSVEVKKSNDFEFQKNLIKKQGNMIRQNVHKSSADLLSIDDFTTLPQKFCNTSNNDQFRRNAQNNWQKKEQNFYNCSIEVKQYFGNSAKILANISQKHLQTNMNLEKYQPKNYPTKPDSINIEVGDIAFLDVDLLQKKIPEIRKEEYSISLENKQKRSENGSICFEKTKINSSQNTDLSDLSKVYSKDQIFWEDSYKSLNNQGSRHKEYYASNKNINSLQSRFLLPTQSSSNNIQQIPQKKNQYSFRTDKLIGQSSPFPRQGYLSEKVIGTSQKQSIVIDFWKKNNTQQFKKH